MKNIIKNNYFIVLVIIFSGLLLSTNLNKPFIGHHDWNGAFWGEETKRYLTKAGLGESEYLRSLHLSPKSLYFPDYTPLLPITFSLISVFFGLSESTLRLVPTIFSLLMLFFIYKIGELLFERKVGLFASIFAALTPMFLYFGKLPDHEPIVTSLITISFYFYLKSFENKSKYGKFFLVFFILSLLESWPAFFIIPFLTLHSIYLKKEKIAKVFLPWLFSIFVICAHLGSIFLIFGINGLTQFVKQGNSRMNSPADLIGGFSNYSPYTFLTTEAHYAVIYFTRILIILSLLWLITVIFKIFRKKINSSEISLLILFAYPLSFILVFRQLAFIHDYKLYHFLPFISLSSASVVSKGFKSYKNLRKKTNIFSWTQITIITFLLIAITVFFERYEYLNTLLKTSFNTPGYDLGLLIKKKTSPQEDVLVNSMQFKGFFGVFVNYYSDRQVDYEDITLENFSARTTQYQKYKYLISIEGRDTDSNFIKYLENNYPSDKFGEYRFFNINSRM